MPPYTATAWSKRDPQGGGDGELISQVKQEFDGRGNLLKDWQSFGTEIVSGTPKTEYEWDVDYTGSPEDAGHTRLSGMDYPRFTTGAYLRTVDFGYGTAQAMPDALGQVRTVESTKNSVTKEVGVYGWVGTGRRAYRTFAEESGSNVGGTQDYRYDQVMEQQNGQIGLIGLDPWGRVTAVTFHTGGPAVISPTAQGTFAYTYDLAGRRVTCTRTPDPWISLPNGGSEKQTDDYDGLSRLIGFKATTFNGSTTRIEQDWQLDLLGNWTERETSTPNPDTWVRHFTDERNRIGSVETEVDGQSPVSVEFIYDDAGNLAFDGTYAYQYDAWNRLVSIHAATLNGNGEIVLGTLQKHHTYDAIGRLARTLSPYPSPAQQSGGALRSERFYYDGIRRLVEVQIDTIKSLAGALAGNQTVQDLANDALELSDGDIDQSAAPAAYEVAYIAAASPTVTTPREYVWGPGDKGIYELVCQFDGAGAPLWPWQDEGGDVVGACDAGGASGASRLVGVWSYGPYGEVLKDATVVSHSPIHAGHKGLFVDRLDAGVAGIGGAEAARLATGATHAVFANNRHLLPKLGRWAQADPNASGLVVLAMASRGHGLGNHVADMDLNWIFGDGAHLYQYVSGSPWGASDPTGLSELIGAMFASVDMADMMLGMMEEAYGGVVTFLELWLMLDTYASDQDDDAYWAEDWDADDNDSSDGFWLPDPHEVEDDLWFPGEGFHENGYTWSARDKGWGFGKKGWGPKGKPSTRKLAFQVARELQNKHPGYRQTQGHPGKEELIEGPGGGVRGSTRPDLTFECEGKPKIRVQTVTMTSYKGQGTPIPREMDALRRIKAAHPEDILYWVPKRGNIGGLQWHLVP